MSNRAKLGNYSLVRFKGAYYRVDSISGNGVSLRSTDNPQSPLLNIKLQALLSADDFEVYDSATIPKDTSLYEAILDSIPANILGDAQELKYHIQEIITGHKHGAPPERTDTSIEARYDPSLVSLDGRVKHKAKELNIGIRQMWRLYRRYTEKGLYGLVDQRRLQTTQRIEDINPILVDAIREVTRLNKDKSTRPLSVLRREVEAYLVKQGEDPTEYIRSRPVFNRTARTILKGTSYLESARSHRNYLSRPKKVFSPLRAIRPGEFVLIDASYFDVMAYDSAGKKIRYRLLLAIDLYSRAILAWRFLEYDPKGVDATMLLYDILHPVAMDEHWPEECRYPYLGVPETIIIDLFDEEPRTKFSNIPPLNPDTIVIDNGKIFIGNQFKNACEILGISLYLSNPYTPTDKPQIERIFRTAAQQLFSHMSGYLGSTTEMRGKEADSDAFYFIFEIDRIFGEWANLYNQTPHTSLRHDLVPTVFHTPSEMFDLGITSMGYYHIPVSKSISFSLLRTVWRRINHYGVEVNGLIYNHPNLLYLQNRDSNLKEHNGKWPFKVDDRLLTYIYFYDEAEQKWLTLKRQFSDHPHLPFNAFHLDQVRKKLTQNRGFMERAKEVSAALDRLLSSFESVTTTNRKHRQDMIKSDNSTRQILQAQKDQGTSFKFDNIEHNTTSKIENMGTSADTVSSEEIRSFGVTTEYEDDIDDRLGDDLWAD